MASSLGIQAQFVQENSHKLVDIRQSSAPERVTLPMNEVILEFAKSLWNTSISITPMAKHTDERYCVPMQGFKYFFSHPPPNSLVVTEANERVQEGRCKFTPKYKV